MKHCSRSSVVLVLGLFLALGCSPISTDSSRSAGQIGNTFGAPTDSDPLGQAGGAPSAADAGAMPLADAGGVGSDAATSLLPTASFDASAADGAIADVDASSPVTPVGPFAGGFLEPSSSTAVRPRLSASQLQALVPAAGGKFTFPAPYNTEAIRITDAGDCGGSGDCVRYIGYSYWRNINNHVGQSTMLIMLGLAQQSGGAGLSLFRYHKDTDALEALGPIFTGGGFDPNMTGEGVYFSGTRPNTLYVAQGPKLVRFDVLTKQTEVAFDAGPKYGANTYLWQHHSSDDDVVHSATLRDSSSGSVLGCLLHREDTGAFNLFAPAGGFDECQVDRSGDWLVIKDNLDGNNGEDNRIINTKTLAEKQLLDENGAGGHSDLGYGVMVAEDNWNSRAGAVRVWRLGENPLSGPLVYYENEWRSGSGHISHTNARPGLSPSEEVACQSTLSSGDYTRGNEIFCYRLDGSLEVMVVAPVMTDLNAAGGGDDYSKAPKGNLDITGRYFLWTSNIGTGRLDAFIVKVPSLLGSN